MRSAGQIQGTVPWAGTAGTVGTVGAALPLQAGRSATTGRRTALVADDDADVRDLVTFKLEQAGFAVTAVGDGLHALEAVTAMRPMLPSIALIDVMMPGLSGIDVVRELRRDPMTRPLPVLLLTAKAQEHDVEAGFAIGADDYVAKPFSPRELLSRVMALMARTGA